MKRMIVALLMLCAAPLSGQQDTLMYDGISDIYDGYLIAGSRFPGEIDMLYNARFSPTGKCYITGIQVGLCVVKFKAHDGEDTLLVQIFENASVPPRMPNVFRTFKYALGDMGYPNPNVGSGNPFDMAQRGILTIPFSSPVPVAPARDILIGIKLQTRQEVVIDSANDIKWNGFALLMKLSSPEYQRYHRYSVASSDEYSSNNFATDSKNVSIFMRAFVTYDPTIPDTELSGREQVPACSDIALSQNRPNPFSGSTTISYSLKKAAAITLTVHDMLGRCVAVLEDGFQTAGDHEAVFNSGSALSTLPAGLYLVRLSTVSTTVSRAVMMLR
jgi:hypothetical protein